MFGKELIIDLYECDTGKFNRDDLTRFFRELCDLIEMVPEELHFWDYVDCPEEYDDEPDHLKGTSAVQFIRTSNITIHTLDVLGEVYLNIFSCKDFDRDASEGYCLKFFSAQDFNSNLITRGLPDV